MPTAKTNSERQAALKVRRKAAGLVPVTVWVYPESRDGIKLSAARMVEAGDIIKLYRKITEEEAKDKRDRLTKVKPHGKMRET